MLPNLKRLREESGISQQKLADAVRVSQPSIYKYENQNIEPDITTLSAMADYFNTSIDYIVGRTDERRPIEHTETFQLNHYEAELITGVRCLSDKERACVEHVVRTLLEK